MARIAVLTWFTFLTLLGPNVCCCDLFHHVMSAAPTEKAASPAPIHACCHSEPAHRNTGSTPHAPTQPKPPTKCPCKDQSSAQASLPGSESDPTTAAGLRDLVTDLVAALTTPLAFDQSLILPPPRPQAVSGPMLAGRSLLAAYSILRC